jgi:hypothetical protein
MVLVAYRYIFRVGDIFVENAAPRLRFSQPFNLQEPKREQTPKRAPWHRKWNINQEV